MNLTHQCEISAVPRVYLIDNFLAAAHDNSLEVRKRTRGHGHEKAPLGAGLAGRVGVGQVVRPA
jgi:hypothetical protein